jgi:CBS domain-containing protein
MIVKDIMHKGLHLVSSDITIKQAVALMNQFNIGSILVGNPEKLDGIFSERDLMVKVVVPGLSIDKTFIRDVMTKQVLTARETDSIEEVLPKMEKKKIRHLPVVNQEGICTGMLGARDLMGAMLNKIETENNIMVEYLLAVSRVVMTIMDLARENGVKDGDKVVVRHKRSKNELETLTDTSRKTLNKIVENLQDEGLISFSRNKIIILDSPKLQSKII